MNIEPRCRMICHSPAVSVMGRFLTVDSSTSIEELLFDQLLRKGWIR